MAAKSEVVLWCRMVDSQVRPHPPRRVAGALRVSYRPPALLLQVRRYREFSSAERVRSLLAAGKGAEVFTLILRLRQLSNSSALVAKEAPAVSAAGTASDSAAAIAPHVCASMEDCAAEPVTPAAAAVAAQSAEDDGGAVMTARRLLEGSGKLQLFVRLVRALRADGLRILVFSQWARMLDLLEVVLDAMSDGSLPPEFDAGGSPSMRAAVGSTADSADTQLSRRRSPKVAHVRVDGTVPAARRAAIVADFNDPGSAASVFLLTSGVGSLGLTLTSATRVVIFDPCWNPQVDSQAVDR